MQISYANSHILLLRIAEPIRYLRIKARPLHGALEFEKRFGYGIGFHRIADFFKRRAMGIVIKQHQRQANRDQLSDDKRQALEAAYAEIVGTEDLSTLNKKVKKMANKLGVDVSELAVSDLFDISMTECTDHAKHGKFDIVLNAETLENFVCLLHYYNGEWTVVKNAELSKEDYLEFSQAEFSPFAIVTYTGEQNIQKDENALLVGIVVASSATVGVAVCLGVKFGTFAKMFANIAKLFK